MIRDIKNTCDMNPGDEIYIDGIYWGLITSGPYFDEEKNKFYYILKTHWNEEIRI